MYVVIPSEIWTKIAEDMKRGIKVKSVGGPVVIVGPFS